MARTANVFARVEPELKAQAEQVLDRLGIPMSNAVDVYKRQMVYIADIQKEVLMTNQKKIPVSARRRTETIQLYHQFFMKYFNEEAKKE